MAGYQRKTALGPRASLEMAAKFLPEFIGLKCTRQSPNAATYTGEEGIVTLHAYRHGPYTEVTAETDRLRTSRMDYEIQRFLNTLPYEHGDAGGPGSGDPR